MKKGERWKIYWDNYLLNAYLYGSEIDFRDKDDVIIHNNLIPPGTVMKTWYSKTNFQGQRIEPSLPIIDGEGEYIIRNDIESDIEGGIIIRVLYYDRHDVEIGQLIIKEKEKRFRCPMATYSYRLQLINAGARNVRFHSIEIQEVLYESEEQAETI